jgi:hypothetical protein
MCSRADAKGFDRPLLSRGVLPPVQPRLVTPRREARLKALRPMVR